MYTIWILLLILIVKPSWSRDPDCISKASSLYTPSCKEMINSIYDCSKKSHLPEDNFTPGLKKLLDQYYSLKESIINRVLSPNYNFSPLIIEDVAGVGFSLFINEDYDFYFKKNPSNEKCSPIVSLKKVYDEVETQITIDASI